MNRFHTCSGISIVDTILLKGYHFTVTVLCNVYYCKSVVNVVEAEIPQLAFTFSKSAIETAEQCAKSG